MLQVCVLINTVCGVDDILGRTRDVLDALIVALRNLPVGIHALHADLNEAQAVSTIAHYQTCLPSMSTSVAHAAPHTQLSR